MFIKNQLLNFTYQIYTKEKSLDTKSLISDIATGGIFGLGDNGYILAIIAMQNMLQK